MNYIANVFYLKKHFQKKNILKIKMQKMILFLAKKIFLESRICIYLKKFV